MLYTNPIVKVIEILIYIFFGLILARFISNLLNKAFKNVELDKFLIKEMGLKFSVRKYSIYVVKYLIYFITLLLVLSKIGISTSGLQKFLLGFLVLLVILILLSFRTVLPNLTAGISLRMSNKFKKEDIVHVHNMTGRITEVGLLETKIMQNNEIVHIPNKLLLTEGLIKR